MATYYEGQLNADGMKFGIIVSRFNDFITARLLDGCLDALQRHGANGENISVYRVPGAFEVPVMAKKLAESGKFDSVIALGAVIRGATDHYTFVASEVSKGIASVSLNTGVPVIFGVLTTDTIEQAIERAGTKAGNKGAESAVTAIEMVDLLRRI